MQQLVSHLVSNRQTILTLLNVHEYHADLNGAFRKALGQSVLQLIYARQLAAHIKVPVQYLASLYVSNAMTFITWTLMNGEDYHIVYLMDKIQNSLSDWDNGE